MKIHIVQKGDTLWNLSKKYNVDFEQLKAANTHLTNPDMIMPGMKIKIPTGSVPVKKEMPIKEAPKKEVQVKKEMPIQQPVQQPIMQPQIPHMSNEYEMNMNFNIYKPQPIKKEVKQQAPMMHMPKMPQPPQLPKIEKPKEKIAEAPKQPKEMKQPMKQVQPKEQPHVAQQIPMQPYQMPVMMQPQHYVMPCPPYYPISPVMPGCAPHQMMPQPYQPFVGYEQLPFGQGDPMYDYTAYQQANMMPYSQTNAAPYSAYPQQQAAMQQSMAYPYTQPTGNYMSPYSMANMQYGQPQTPQYWGMPQQNYGQMMQPAYQMQNNYLYDDIED